MRRAATVAALAAVLAAGLAGISACHSHSAPTAALSVGAALAADQSLARTLDDVPRALDPQLVTDLPAQHVLDDLFEGLVSVGIDGRPAPGVAASWDTSADGLNWLFHLRPQARWSNGEAVTADDFVYTFRRELDPQLGASYAQTLAPIAHAMDVMRGRSPASALGVEALDAHTLAIHLAAPTPYLLELLDQFYLYPVYRPAVERYGGDWTSPAHLVSNGAFVLRDNVLGNRITLEKNPQYWNAASVRLEHLTYYPIIDRSQAVLRYLAGDVQFTDSYAIAQQPWLRARLGSQLIDGPWLGTYQLGFNFNQPPFAHSPALRLALSLAIDRLALTQYLKFGIYPPAYTLVPAMPGFQPPQPQWAQQDQTRREQRSRALYRQAGYSAQHPLRLVLSVPVQGADERHFYEAVAAMWRSVLGAQVRLDELEFKVLWQQRRLNSLSLYHDAWLADFADPINFLQRYYGGSALNYGGYANARFDALLDQAARERDGAERLRLLGVAEQVLDADVAYIPLYYYATRHLIKPYVQGWQSNLMDRNLSRYMFVLEHRGK